MVALRTLVTSIFHTLKSLVWAMVLLTLIVYVFAAARTGQKEGHRTGLWTGRTGEKQTWEGGRQITGVQEIRPPAARRLSLNFNVVIQVDHS